MPNLKSLKALRKLMQEEGLLRQTEKTDPFLAKELKRKLEYKKAGAEVDARDAIEDARYLRSKKDEHDLFLDSARLQDHPYSKNKLDSSLKVDPLLVNQKVREDLKWARRPKNKMESEYEATPPSQRNVDFSGSYEENAAMVNDYENALNKKWDQIRSLLEKKKSE